MQLGYFSRLKSDSQRWIDKGIIDKAAADAILSDVESHKKGYSFSSIVILLGLVCLGFAAMTFVAANWDAMPKYGRVLLLLAALWASYIAAIYANKRSNPLIADFLAMLGSAIFGATIMLVGQLYHLQGATEDAVLIWAGGTVLAAIALKSNASLWLSIVLFTLWFVLGHNFNFGKDGEINFFYPVFWLLCAGVAYWLHAYRSAHLLMLGMLFWVAVTVMTLSARHETLSYLFVVYASLYLGISLALISLERWKALKGFEAPFVSYLVMCVIILTAIWVAFSSFASDSEKAEAWMLANHIPMIACLLTAGLVFALSWRYSLYDVGFCAFWIGVALLITSSFGMQIPFLAEAASLGLAIWLIRMGDRQDIASVTRQGYVAFAMVMLLIYFRTVGTLLGTTGFYLVSGVLLVAGAIFLPRLFRLLRRNKEGMA